MSKQSELDRWCVAFLDGDMSAGQFKRAVANLVTRQSNKQIEKAMAKFSLKKGVKYDVKATDTVIVITPTNKLKEEK